MQVEVTYEDARWCGYRKPGKNGLGLYLIGPGNFEPCERLPFPLEVCPCCGVGIKPARGFTWINPAALFDPWSNPACCEVTGKQVHGLEHEHGRCPMCNPIGVAGDKAGILWIGERNYKTSYLFMEEAARMGISRKIGALPNGFVMGRHHIYLAHRKVYTRRSAETGLEEWAQAVFSCFKPIRLDIVIDDADRVPQAAVDLAQRVGDAARIIKVIPMDDNAKGDDSDDF